MAIIRGMSDRLQKAVNKSGLPPKQIWKRIGMSESRFYALLAGDGGCYASTFARLCVVLGVSADWLLGLKGGE